MHEEWHGYINNDFNYINDQLILILSSHINDLSNDELFDFLSRHQLIESPENFQSTIKTILIVLTYYQKADFFQKLIIRIIRNNNQDDPNKNISDLLFLNSQISNLLNKFPINSTRYTIRNFNSFFKFDDQNLEILDAIKNDNVDELQQILISNEGYLKKPFKLISFFDFSNQYQDAYLIEYAAYFQAVNCFKFLYLRQALYSKYFNAFAIAGGNGEIIHICENLSNNYTYCLWISIYLHRNSLFEWLVMQKRLQPDIECFIASVKYHNLYLFYQILDEFHDTNWALNKQIGQDRIHDIITVSIQAFEPEMLQLCIKVFEIDRELDFEIETVLALKTSSFECFKVLLQSFNMKSENFASKLFVLSVKYCHLPFCKLISEHYQDEIDYTYHNEKGYTALHIAVLLNDLSKTQFILDIYNNNQINVNVKDNYSVTPFSYAAREGNLEIISMFLKNQSIRVNEHDVISHFRYLLYFDNQF